MNVHQVLSGAGPVDAVTGQARAFRRLFSSWGWGGRDVAGSIDPRVGRAIAPRRTLDPGPGDVLLLHYSAYAPRLVGLLDLPQRKLLISHNVTPAHWLWEHDPQVAIQCSLGRRQLPLFARGVDVAAGVSHYNAAELAQAGARETEVIPILFEPGRLGPAGEGALPSPAPVILFVGRLAPHKRQDEVIRVFAQYRRNRAPGARLVLVGEPLNRRYGEALAALAQELAPGAVSIQSSLPPEALVERYRAAHAFLCLSEHEGFCVPLLEAMHLGVPVIARPAGGIPEVAGDAALLVADTDHAVLSELLHLAVSRPGLRAELRERGRRRVAAYAPQRTAERLREVLERLG